MTAVVLWKEYRQQRALWLALVFGAILFALLLAATLGQGNGFQMFHQDPLRGTLLTVVFAFAIGYGIVSGALLLAGESDDGTVYYLDALAGRGELWMRKCLAGLLLTLALSVVLSALSLGLGFMSWPFVLLVPILSLEAFAWGMLGGALCQRVLTAVLTGIAFLAGSWIVFLVFGWLFGPILLGESPFWSWINAEITSMFPGERVVPLRDVLFAEVLGIAKTGAAVTAGYLSWFYYSTVDRLRQPYKPRARTRKFSMLLASMLGLVWLILRQGRWALAVCLVLGIVLASTAKLPVLTIWPIGTLLLGLVCGLSTFLADQPDGVRFLGAQRFPPGRIWIMKVGVSALILFAITGAAWYVRWQMLLAEHLGPMLFSDWMGMGMRYRILNPLILLGIWPVYGFCLGLWSAQIMPRPVMAVILAVLLAPLVGIWLPSFLLGGLLMWQVLVVPVLLLLLSLRQQRSWLTGRLRTGKPLLGLMAGTVLVMLGLAGSLWYRVLEIPDVGEPFDVPAFKAALHSAEQNEAGPLIRRAGQDMSEYLAKVKRELPPPTQQLFPGGNRPGMPDGQVLEEKPDPPGSPARAYQFAEFLVQIQYKGWPKQDREMVQWLDRVFQGPWVQEAEKAAQLPLGVIMDPLRQLNSKRDADQLYENNKLLVRLFTIRAMQFQVRGEARDSLRYLETALALARQMKNYAVNFALFWALDSERTALDGYRFWLLNAPRDKALLREALAILQRHEAANPSPANSVKADYVNFLNNDFAFSNDPGWLRELLALSIQVPWEKERQRRLVNAIFIGQFRASRQPLWEYPGPQIQMNGFAVPSTPFRYKDFPRLLGLPPADGPGSNLSTATWLEHLSQFDDNHPPGAVYVLSLAQFRANTLLVHLAELATALALYQVDHGTPETVAVVVPDYLAAVPNDPLSGDPIGYRISKGEHVTNSSPPIRLAPGQAIVTGSRGGYFPLPYWKK